MHKIEKQGKKGIKGKWPSGFDCVPYDLHVAAVMLTAPALALFSQCLFLVGEATLIAYED